MLQLGTTVNRILATGQAAGVTMEMEADTYPDCDRALNLPPHVTELHGQRFLVHAAVTGAMACSGGQRLSLRRT